ncbi:MAG: VCBS repeat-containing protein [Gemmatimonadetes bacterium]|nr:VCBS repeat-containing protein [Gemmatimonadota bacterium]
MTTRPSIGATASILPLAFLFLAARSSSAAPPDFTEQLEFGGGPTICVAWGDPDGDGDPDLAVGNTGAQNWLFRNDGGSVFSQFDEFEQGQTFTLTWADCDNDGDLDLAVGNRLAANRLFENNGDGTFTTRTRFGNFLTITIALAWADYDLDGDLDVAVGNGILGSAQENYLYRNDGGNNVFTQTLQFGAGQTQSVVWGDFDQDGDPDLAVGNGGFGFVEQNYLYVNNGDGTFTERMEYGTGDTTSLGWGDADNDGDLDLAVANWDGGQNYLYRNDGGTFAEIPQFGLRDPNTLAWADYDNDGDLDLAVGNGDFGSADSNYLYVNEGNLVFTESAQFGLGSTDGVAWADYDLDGDLDLAVGNEHSPNDNALYINQENDSDWLSLTLVGHFHDLGAGFSNRSGIGAKVAVYEAGFLGDAGHLLGFREIEAHGGFSSQNDIAAHFGLPGQATVDVRITWPGSAGTHVVQDLTGVAVPSRMTVHESGGDVGVIADPRTGGPVWRIQPNPAPGGETLVQYLRPTAEGATAEIVDVAGRRVARLALHPIDGGAEARWDGRNDLGEMVAAGVYFVRGDGEAPGRITVLH